MRVVSEAVSVGEFAKSPDWAARRFELSGCTEGKFKCPVWAALSGCTEGGPLGAVELSGCTEGCERGIFFPGPVKGQRGSGDLTNLTATWGETTPFAVS